MDRDVINLIAYLMQEKVYREDQIKNYFGRSLNEVFECPHDTAPDVDAAPYMEGDQLPKQLREFINAVEQQIGNSPEEYHAFSFPLKGGGGPRRFGQPRSGFIAMPFSVKWSLAVEAVITRAAESSGFVCPSSRGRPTPGLILFDVWRQIRQSDVVVADLTGANPNVYYELGLSHALGKPSILILQDDHDVPFDLQTRRLLRYSLTSTGDDVLEPTLLEKELRRQFELVPWRYEFDKPKSLTI